MISKRVINYQNNYRQNEEDPFEDEYEPITTMEKEILHMDMTQEKIDFYTQLEELSNQDEPLTLEEIEIELCTLFKQSSTTGVFTGLAIGSGGL